MSKCASSRQRNRFLLALSSAFIFLALVLLSAGRKANFYMVQKPFAFDDMHRTEVEEYRVWFTLCEHVLIDLGANRGDTILRWLTQEAYSGRAQSSAIDKIYSLNQRQAFCVLSFEPNGLFDSTLLEIEKKLCENGFRVKVKLRTAVSDRFAESLVYLDDVSTYSYGTSLISEKKVNFEGRE